MTGTANTKRFGRNQSLRRPPVEKGRWAAKGTKPLPEQASIKHVISVMIIHLCRKVLFIETRVKITLYSLALFFGSLVFDFMPVPRTYLSSKDNIFNLYFVKIGWAWLLSIVGSFVYLTSATYGCGRVPVIQQHMGRLVVGTIVWGFVTQWLFVAIESGTGTCLGKAVIADKWSCITSGFQWHAFDVSGHAFLLVYMNLVIVEEAQAIVGWETIREVIFHEAHYRKNEASSASSSSSFETSSESSPSMAYASPNAQSDAAQHSDQEAPLRTLTDTDFFTLKGHYEGYTPYIRVMFILMTWLSIACDVLLASTVVYFHTMPQKVVGGAFGIGAWYATYRFLFKGQWPGLPGDGGVLKYQATKEKTVKETPHQCKRTPHCIITKDQKTVPMFMGMPMYGALKKDDKGSREGSFDDGPDEKSSDSTRAPTGHAMGGPRRNRLPSTSSWR